MDELKELKQRMMQERPADWEHLPDLSLYMDQLISYMPRQLIHFNDCDVLTSAMVNNYIKDGLVPRAEGKRYGPVHLGYLTAVCALKKVLSVRDVGTLISAGKDFTTDDQRLYTYFNRALDQALNDTATAVDEETPREELARLALDLAVRSYANQLACARILEIIQPASEGHKGKRSKAKADQ